MSAKVFGPQRFLNMSSRPDGSSYRFFRLVVPKSRVAKSTFIARISTMSVLAFVVLIAPSTSVVAQWSTGTNINNTNSGTVSVGTTNPGGDKLIAAGNVLAGNITAHTQLYSGYDSQDNPIIELGYGTATANIIPLPYLVISKNLTSTNNLIGVIAFANSSIANGNEKRISGISSWTDGATNSGALQFATSSAGTLAERMRITSGGNVGIGTSAPSYAFDVYGNAQWIARFKKTDSTNGGIIIESNTGYNPNLALSVGGTTKWYLLSNVANSDALQFWESTGSGPRFTLTQAGNLGLGTASPLQKLQLGSNTSTPTSTPDAISLGATYSSSAGANPKLRFFDNNAGSVYGIGVSDNQFDFMIPTSARYVWNVNGVEKMRLDNSGNVTISGSIAAKYQDVAEWVESSQVLAPGTVVVLDQSKSNQVVASSKSYDTRVAGVISTQPGLALGEKGESKVLVATTGRVRIKVDASSGPIQIGDLLVTSDIPGVAKKSEPLSLGGVEIHRPGTLIGKALEPLAKGTGEILTLLSLQ